MAWFPDGRALDFNANLGAGPYGVTEYIENPYPYNEATLRLSDGGKVVFTQIVANPGHYQVSKIVDPYGHETTIVDSGTGTSKTTKITEPGGRYLLVSYAGPNGSISKVQAFDGVSGHAAIATINYGWTGSDLSNVTYNDGTISTYSYADQTYPGPPVCTYPWDTATWHASLLKTCDDVRFSGAMDKIEYVYVASGPNRTRIVSEKNPVTGDVLSTISGVRNSGTISATETRGDGATRTFNYYSVDKGPDCPPPDTEPPLPQPTDGKLKSYTDFLGRTSIIGYDDPPSGGAGFITSVTDANLNKTIYERGAAPVRPVTKIKRPDTSFISQTYTDPVHSYFLDSRTNERGYMTKYLRNPMNASVNPNAIITKEYRDLDGVTVLEYETFEYNAFGQIIKHRLRNGAYEHFEYDSRGLLINKWAPTWNATPTGADPKTSYTYYPDGESDKLPWTDRVKQETDPRGNRTIYEYDRAYDANNENSGKSGTAPCAGRGLVTKVGYPDDTHGNTIPGGTAKTFGFDKSANKLWEETELQKRTTYVYDAYGRVTSVTDPVGNVTTNSYVPWGKTSSYLTTLNLPFVTTAPAGRATNKTINTYYDGNWRKTRVQEAPGTSLEANTWFGYDYVGNPTYVTDPLGSGANDPTHTITTTYDNRNRKHSVTDPQGHVTIYGYDLVGNVTSITRPDTSVVAKEYDHMNRVTKDTTPKGGPANAPTSWIVTQFRYYLGKDSQMCGELEKVIDGEGRGTKFTYWPFGLKKEMFYPLDNAGNTNPADYQAWTYDASHNLQTRRTVNNEVQTFQYDSRNRKMAMTWSNSADYANFSYDAAGRLTNADNAASSVVRSYTDAGELKSDDQNVTGLGTKVVNYDYTKSKPVRLYANGVGYDYTFGYDEMGRFATIAPTGSSTAFQYGYDAASNEIQRTNNLNSVYQTTPRDNLNRMTRRDVKLGANVLSYEEYGYDVMSRLNQVDREDNTRDSFGYDLSGQLVNATYGTPLATPTPTPTATPTATPTPTVTPTPTATPSNQCAPVTFSTTGGYPTTLKVYMSTATSGATIFYTIGNSPPANPTHNGNTATGSTVKYTGAVNVNVGQYKYFKAIAYKSGMTDSIITTFEAENTNNGGQFAAQSMSLLSVSSPRVVTYNLDKVGNRTGTNGVVDDGVAKNYAPNPLNQYTTAESEGVVNGPHHEVTSFQGVSYAYINDERVKTITSAGNTYQLAYDALGRCVKRTLNSTTTYYIYDGEKPILEYSGGGTLLAANLYGKEIDEILARTDYSVVPNRLLYYQDDHEGSITHLTDISGGIIESYRYDAFGAPAINGGSITLSIFGNRFMFTGREYQSTFKVYEYRARSYHPAIGRFMSEDPKLYVQRAGYGTTANWSFSTNPDQAEFNLFRYCGNDPVDFVDPLGEDVFGYDSVGDYGHEVGQVFAGYGQAVADTVSGFANMVAHPVLTAQGVAAVVSNPGEAVSAVGQAVSESWESGSKGQGRVVGHALIALGTAGSAKASSLAGQAASKAPAMGRLVSAGVRSFMAGKRPLSSLTKREVGRAIRGYKNAANAAKNPVEKAFQEARIKALLGERESPGSLSQFKQEIGEPPLQNR